MAAFSNKAPMLLALIGFAAADRHASPVNPTVEKASAFKKDTLNFEDAALTTAENTEAVDFGLKIAEERRLQDEGEVTGTGVAKIVGDACKIMGKKGDDKTTGVFDSVFKYAPAGTGSCWTTSTVGVLQTLGEKGAVDQNMNKIKYRGSETECYAKNFYGADPGQKDKVLRMAAEKVYYMTNSGGCGNEMYGDGKYGETDLTNTELLIIQAKKGEKSSIMILKNTDKKDEEEIAVCVLAGEKIFPCKEE